MHTVFFFFYTTNMVKEGRRTRITGRSGGYFSSVLFMPAALNTTEEGRLGFRCYSYFAELNCYDHLLTIAAVSHCRVWLVDRSHTTCSHQQGTNGVLLQSC